MNVKMADIKDWGLWGYVEEIQERSLEAVKGSQRSLLGHNKKFWLSTEHWRTTKIFNTEKLTIIIWILKTLTDSRAEDQLVWFEVRRDTDWSLQKLI